MYAVYEGVRASGIVSVLEIPRERTNAVQSISDSRTLDAQGGADVSMIYAHYHEELSVFVMSSATPVHSPFLLSYFPPLKFPRASTAVVVTLGRVPPVHGLDLQRIAQYVRALIH